MAILNTNCSKIELVDGEFYTIINGTKEHIFLYKYKRVNRYTTLEDVINTNFDYDLIVLDKDKNTYMYFTYNYKDDPEEVF